MTALWQLRPRAIHSHACNKKRTHHEEDPKFWQKPPFFREILRHPWLKRHHTATRLLGNREDIFFLLHSFIRIARKRELQSFWHDSNTHHCHRKIIYYFNSKLHLQRKSTSNFGNFALTVEFLLCAFRVMVKSHKATTITVLADYESSHSFLWSEFQPLP